MIIKVKERDNRHRHVYYFIDEDIYLLSNNPSPMRKMQIALVVLRDDEVIKQRFTNELLFDMAFASQDSFAEKTFEEVCNVKST